MVANGPQHDKTNKMTYAPSEDSDQPGHPPSLIRVFAVRMKKHWDAQADLSLHWVQRSFCWFYHEAAQIVSIWAISWEKEP